ncbi:minichromosome maintenance protein MCM [Halorubrum distributum]|uniref:minichromosome maintenance protein MCM n=1 Tax=Halorubrum distributum TaxID=29283 RepID=UPI0006776AA2|nr:minichromosome maintenance protein MCM [Halorubrum terrestre]
MANQDLTDRFIQFYRNYYREEVGTLAQRYPNEQRSLYIKYDDLFQFDRDLAEDFRNKPDQIRQYAEEALRLYDLPADVSLGRAHVRMEDLPDNVDIRGIRVHDNLIGSLVSFRGVVRKATDVRPRVTEASFECQRCGTMTYIPQSDGDFQEPQECQGCERQGPFRINMDQSEFVDSQEIRVQESPEGLETGETPQSIDVELSDDLCGEATPGDHITIVGTLRAEQIEGGNNSSPLIDLYVDGLSISPSDEFDFAPTSSEEQHLHELIDDGEIFSALRDSIAPSIYGLEEEKLAVLLQLYGGVQKRTEDGELIRGQPHVLLVGDPAVGLSRILRSAARIAPRSTYSNGAETSKAGLTAAAARTGGKDGPWELKVGALPIADRGLAVIDNLSEIGDDAMGALTEPMEQQQITISKASIHETVDTRVGVLAAGSPEYGMFDQYEPIAEQLGVDAQSFTLFDLVFTVTDSPDPDKDEETANHVLEINRTGELQEAGVDPEPPESIETPLDAPLIQKHIAISRQISPVLSSEAEDRITEFYVDLRSKGADDDGPVPVTARKLETLVRLSEASARVRLSDTIEVEDADRVIELVESCLKDIGVDPGTGQFDADTEQSDGETKQFDADVVETDTSKSQRDRIKNIKELIADIDEKHQEGAPVTEVLNRADEIGMSSERAEAEIEKLRNKGEVYSPKKDYLRTT